MRTDLKLCSLQLASSCQNVSHKLDLAWSLMGWKLCTQVQYKTWDIKWTVKFKSNELINKICSTSFLYLWNMKTVQHLVDKKMGQVVLQALVLSRIDCCNLLLIESAEYQMNNLQRFQNMACRVICGVRKFDSISYHLKDLHWLCICEHVAYKICILMFKCYRDITPKYLVEWVNFKSKHSRNLHSNSKFLAQAPRGNNVQTSSSAFSIVGPRLWNDLPVILKVKENIKDFKVALKTHLFKESYQ